MRSIGLECRACGGTIKTGLLAAPYGIPVFARTVYSCPSCHISAFYTSAEATIVDG